MMAYTKLIIVNNIQQKIKRTTKIKYFKGFPTKQITDLPLTS